MTDVAVEQPQKKKAFEPGEQFPLKGFWFTITEVNKTGFVAQISGVTKRLQGVIGGDVEKPKGRWR